MELVDKMKKGRVNVSCLQETKWKGDKFKELIDGYKLQYIGKNYAKRGESIIVDRDLKEKIVGVKRLGDKLITIKRVLEEDIMI